MSGAVACQADSATQNSASGASDEASSDGQTSDTGAQRTLVIPTPVELCARSPQRQAFGAAPLFYFRSITRLPAGMVELPDEDGVDSTATLPFTIQSSAGAVEAEFALPGEVRVDRDMVPSSIYSLVDAEGWDTVSHLTPESSGSVPHNFLFQLAYPTGAETFALSSVEMLDAELRLDVVSFMTDYADSSSFRSAGMAPCRLEDTVVDRIDVTFAEGNASFHTRPAFWKKFSGFTVLAEGDVAGIAFEVDSYWDLEYATSDMGSDLYALGPLLAVRFPEQADGACILVVEPDVYDPDEAYVARILDCEQNELLPLTIESMELVLGGGEHRW